AVRAYLPDYELRAPRDLAAVLALLSEDPGAWKPFAGGTDLMVLLEAAKLPHKKFLSLWRLAELRGVEVSAEAVALGALTTYTEVMRHPVLQQEFPLLCRAARETGGVATQNRGTLAGNIANASPAADSPPALLAYDAELEIVSARGSRRRPYHGFHSGYKQMDLAPDELITRIHLRRKPAPRRHYYRKVGTRKAQAISKVVLAGVAEVENGAIRDLRIALGSVAPTVVRCNKTEDVLRGRKPDRETLAAARAALAAEISPIDDFRSTAHYRRRVSQNLLEEFLLSLQ
ncbi:MAG: FAD binding domain-containing protein, partial [Candidatus Acidiferrales bacterium]